MNRVAAPAQGAASSGTRADRLRPASPPPRRPTLRRTPLAALLLSLAAGGAAAQTASPAASLAENQRQALAAVRAAADALGGDAVVTGLQRLEVVQRDTLVSGVQAPRPGDTIAVPLFIRTTVDFARNRAVRDTDQRYPGGYRFHFRNTFTPTGGVSFDLQKSRAGIEHGRNTPQASTTTLGALPRILPAGYLRQALQNAGSLRHLGTAAHGGRTYEAVSYADATGVVFTLFLDADRRLAAVERLLPQGPGLAVYRVDFEGYRAFGPMTAPERIVARVNGGVTQTSRIDRITVDAEVPDSLFALPAGYVEAAPAGDPRAEAVADGVWALRGMPGGYVSMFVEMADHVVVLEAPQGPQHGETALRLIRETVPGKPVRYVLVTHHHGDHIAGAAPFAAAGATFVTAPGVEPALRAVMGDAAATARFETVADRRTFGTGARRIDVLAAPGAHAASMLMFHLPGAGLVFQGDLLTLPVGPLPLAIPANRDFAAALRRHRVDARTVVGVHGRAGTMDELRAILAGPDAPWTVQER